MTASKPIMAVSKSHVGYYISMDVIVALMFDNSFGTARFLQVKHKASSNAFPIYRFPSRSLHPWASAFLLPDGSKPANWYGSENTAKIRIFYEFVSLYPKKECKIVFHKACETTFGARNGRNVSKNLEVKRKMPIFATTNPARFP